MTAPAEVATLTPQALAAATIALCRPGTITRRRISERDGVATLELRSGDLIRIARYSWAYGGGLWWASGPLNDDLPTDRIEAVRVMVTECESRAGF